MKKQHSFDAIMAMVLFGLFAGAVLMVLLMGTQSYQSVVATTDAGYEAEICLQYMATKAAHYSGEDAVTVVEFGDGSALALTETIDDCDYVTYLYLYDDHLKELLCEAGVTLGPEAGFSIMEAADLSVEQVTSGLLRLSCTEQDGTSAQLYIALHGGEEARP